MSWNVMKCQESWNVKCHEMSDVMKFKMSWNAHADAGSMTPSRNTRRYKLRSVPSSPGRSFLELDHTHVPYVLVPWTLDKHILNHICICKYHLTQREAVKRKRLTVRHFVTSSLTEIRITPPRKITDCKFPYCRMSLHAGVRSTERGSGHLAPWRGSPPPTGHLLATSEGADKPWVSRDGTHCLRGGLACLLFGY